MISTFFEQSRPDGVSTILSSKIDYDPGINQYIIVQTYKELEETFSIGQPVYDCNYNLVGYLSIKLYASTYTYKKNDSELLKVPIYYWIVGNPTKYCKSGSYIYTYWQIHQLRKDK